MSSSVLVGEAATRPATERKRRRVLALINAYVPAYKAGGPIRTLAGIVECLGDGVDFRVITRDRDHAEEQALPGVVTNRWQPVGKAHVFYASKGELTPTTLRRRVFQSACDTLYLNSFFHPTFTIQALILRRLGLLPRGLRVIIAPRGELSPYVLYQKHLKKWLYLKIAAALGLYAGVTWHASGEHEKQDIQRVIGSKARIIVARNLAVPVFATKQRVRHKRRGLLKIVFLSRISSVKNLTGALQMLRNLPGDVVFDIYGPIEDRQYWSQCEALARKLPNNVHAQYRGPLPHERVSGVLSHYDLFLLPTLSENFGHAVLDALLAGCPVLISDQTPWRGLESAGVGWDVPLDQPKRFREVLQRCVRMGADEHGMWSARAAEYGRVWAADTQTILQNRRLFDGTDVASAT